MAITVPSKAAVASGSSFGRFTVDGAKSTNKAVFHVSYNEVFYFLANQSVYVF